MIPPKNLILSLFLSALVLAPGCDSSRPVAPLRDGPAECAELASDCKAPAQALGEPYESCYKTGKAKVNNACINAYYACIDECRTASMGLPSSGAGGAAGAAGVVGEGGATAPAASGGQSGAAGGETGG